MQVTTYVLPYNPDELTKLVEVAFCTCWGSAPNDRQKGWDDLVKKIDTLQSHSSVDIHDGINHIGMILCK